MKDKIIHVAVAGNPNAGKTCIFNALAGATQHVGNYPGVTVEIKSSMVKWGEYRLKMVDLPGTYSLTAYSEEERIARRYIVEEKPDVVLDIIDSSNMERNLYLTCQLMALGANLVLVFNMIDELEQRGETLDTECISARCQAQAVTTIGHRGIGIPKLKEAILHAVENRSRPRCYFFPAEIEEAISVLSKLVPDKMTSNYNARYIATKILEGDEEFINLAKRTDKGEILLDEVQKREQYIRRIHNVDPALLIADARFGFANGLIRECTKRIPKSDRVNLTERIDKVLLNRFAAFPIFFGAMYLLFWIVFTIGNIPMGWIEDFFAWLAGAISLGWRFSELSWLHSLIVDGIIGGVGGVLVFLPNIMLLFLGISILEDTGYMARAAFIMDKFMHKIGLHGKSFIPMLIGFGCTVPAIMATRSLENRRDRLAVMLALPLVSCGARLPIYLLIIPAFFPPKLHAPMMYLIYLVGIAAAVVIIKILRKTVLVGDDAPFVMELPPYRFPTWQGLFHHAWQRAWMYLKKAGTIILGISIILWFLSSYPQKTEFEVDSAANYLSETELEKARATESLTYSFAGRIGKAIEPIISLMGFDWRLGTAFLGSFAAKEVFVAQFGIVFSLGETDERSGKGLRETLRNTYNPLVGFCILIFALIATPCMATFAITRYESGGFRWAILQWGGLTFIGFVLTTIIYQLGRVILY